ncbi:DUF11 domain-containing protein [Acinetobacter cumulans]|uniref:DUF11 domain-containing protein n=1 Tax=Acinetobacter cumulans TaxID=2136182 RepID=A0ABX9U345_9GAMM|nr:DUF11 domain-containing protein [Acinetobacter cumulans]RLL39044.1 DUF11 domain-containing protein [Acinetobacter cumulans]
MWGNKQIMTAKALLNIQQVNKMMNRFLVWIFTLLGCLILSNASFAAPPTIEIFAGSDTSNTQGPTSSSPLQTFLYNSDNPTGNTTSSYTPTTTVVYNVTSVYKTTTYPGNIQNQSDFMIGGTNQGGSIRPAVAADSVFKSLNSLGSPTNSMFAATVENAPASCNDGSACTSTNGGVDVSANYGVSFLATTKGLKDASKPTNGRHLVGTITATFNRPVTNPVLHVSGLGSATSQTLGTGLGFSAEFDLSTPNIRMRRLAGSKELSVTSTSITNNATTMGPTSNSGGASGSVLLEGRGIQVITFNVYLHGDGKTSDWYPNNTNSTADGFFFGISSMNIDSDLSIVKSQRVGKTDAFTQGQLTNVPVGSLMQYQLVIKNNKPSTSTVGGSVYQAPITDILPASLKNVSVVSSTPSSGATCTATPAFTNNSNDTNGYTVNGLFSGATGATCTIVVQGTATVAETLTNIATVVATSTDGSTANDSSTVNAIIVAPTAITADPIIKEARFTITPDLPTIVRGRIGTQTINIKNEGPDAATNPKATYVAAPQTGVIVSSVSVVGGSACVQSGNNWNCNLGGSMANGVTQQLLVTYATASNSALGTAQQATVKVSSDEFNPGSGVGETLYKVWGTNQQNEYRPNGAFWVGYEGTGGTAKVGAFADENSSIVSAWPSNQASPTGGYLVSGANGTSDSTYAASSTTASAMIQRIITNMSSDANSTVKLDLISTPNIGDNRRAWEFTTGIYIPSSQTLTVCIGNTSVGVDDGAYIMVDGNVEASINGWAPGGVTVTTASAFSAGYHRITYRITNRNTHGGISGERAEGGYGPIGLSLSGNCSTADYDTVTGTGVPVSINIIDGAKIKIAKTSINGFGTFNFSSLTNLVNSTTDTTTDSVATVTAGTTATSTTQLWAKVLNTAISITEDTATGYNLTGVSCTDAKSASAGTFGSLAGNILTIPANRITEGANITCTFTNTKVIIVDISGRVFNDNSGTTGDATKAYNAIQDAGEIGIANSAIRLSDCNALTIGTTTTNANGDYGFSIVQTNLPTSFCIAQTNLPEYLSVNADSITVAKTSATSYPNNNFADVKLNVLLTEDGQHTITAGEVTDYPHRLSTQAPVWVTKLEQTQSNSNNDQPWQALVYQDTNCNGTVDTGETVFDPTASGTVLLQPNTDICLVQRVFAPTNIFAGAQHIGTLQASYAVSALNLTDQKTQQRQDVTLIGSAGLTLTKKVRAVTSCSSTPSDSLGFLVNNQATKQQNLEYEITYKNNSVKNLQNVKVKDSLPTGTNFGSVSCPLTPSGNTCSATHSGDVLEWTLTGLLKPSATGTLRFCVSQ